MGKATKKIAKSIKPIIPFAMPMPMRNLNADAAILANVVTNKLGSQVSQKVKDDEFEKGFNEGFSQALACVCNLLMNDWGRLYRKKTRLKVMYAKVCEYQDRLAECDPQQMKAETDFQTQTGKKFKREE